MLTVIVVALVLYGPLFWVIRAAVRDGILAADERRRQLAAKQQDSAANQASRVAAELAAHSPSP